VRRDHHIQASPGSKVRLVAIAPHPIQYHAPLFRALAARPELEFEVAFLEILDDRRQGHGFGVAFQWDVPVLEGYRSRVLPTRRFARGHWGRAVQPRECLRDLEPEVVLLTGWQTLPFVQLLSASQRMGIPALMRGESNTLKPRPWMVDQLHGCLFRHVDAFLAIGRANRGLYEAHGIPSERLFDAPYFVDNEWFSARAATGRAKRAELRTRLGISQEATCFLYAGKFEPKKHPQDLLAALGLLVRTRPDLKIHGLFVGDGVLAPALRARAAAEGLSVTFAGFVNQSEIPSYYAASDALVLPSDYGETWGLVVNEGMACGLPALVSDRVGCGPDLVQPGVTGERYAFGEIEAMARVLETWASTPGLLARMGGAAEEHVRLHYTVGRTVEAVLQAVRFAVHRPTGRAS
jgi:glycosyltransferase involved in cell wall biosynthesis